MPDSRLIQTTDSAKRLVQVPTWTAKAMVEAGTARYAMVIVHNVDFKAAMAEVHPDPSTVVLHEYVDGSGKPAPRPLGAPE